jgi:hypothetical protein
MPAEIEACETVYCQTKYSSPQSIRDDPQEEPDGPTRMPQITTCVAARFPHTVN